MSGTHTLPLAVPARTGGRLVSALALTLCAVVMIMHWRTDLAFTVPWWRWSPGALALLPGVPVIGLLAREVTRLYPGPPSLDPHRSVTWWGRVWVASTVVRLVLGLGRLYATPVSELDAANLIAVISADDATVRGIAVLWVALLVALLGAMITDRVGSAALLVVVVVAVLVGLPTITGAGSHHEALGRTPIVLAGIAVVSGLLWVAVLTSLPSVVRVADGRTSPHARRSLFCGAVVTGLLGVVLAGSCAGLAARWPAALGRTLGTVPGPVTAGQLLVMAVVAVVVFRHRDRVLGGGGHLNRGTVVLVVLGEVAALAAMLLLVVVPTQS